MNTLSRVPFIYQVILTTAGVEQMLNLVNDIHNPSIKRIQVNSSNPNSFQYGYQTGGPYVTVNKNMTYWQDEIDAWNLQLFLVGSVNSQVIAIEVWT